MSSLITTNNIRTIKRYISLFGEDDICNECHNSLLVDCCNKCGNGVCDNDTCSMVFPDKFNKKYFICKHCVDDINKDLHLLIDMGKIELLKKKIKEETTKKQIWRKNSNESLSGYSYMCKM